MLTTAKGAELVKEFLFRTRSCPSSKEGDILDLGLGQALQFSKLPMSTGRRNNDDLGKKKVEFFFHHDGFGSYGALGDRIFDDEISEDEHEFFEAESLRYYANIVAKALAFL